MTTPCKNRLLKLLLIIMMIQPVSLSYAMTGMAMSGMNGGHHAAMATDMLMPVADACQNTPHGQAEHATEQTPPAVTDSTADNCCDTQACCPAFMVNGLTVQQDRPDSLPVVSVDSAMKRIDLPAEIRPPRQLSA